jgi:hypothetical protein
MESLLKSIGNQAVISEGEQQGVREPIIRHSRIRHLFWFARAVACGVLLTLGMLLLIQQVVAVSQTGTDFCQDYVAAAHLAKGEPVYVPLAHTTGGSICPPMTADAHPPPSILLAYPLSCLAYPSASLIWGGCALAAYLASGLLLLRELGWFRLPGISLFVIGSTYWQPVVGAEGAENLWQFLLLLLVLAWILERRGHAASSGALLGFAWLLKLWSTGLFLGALARREWRQALSGGVTIALGTALTAGILGPGTYLTYLGTVRTVESSFVPFNGNVSLVGVFTRLFTGDRSRLPPLFSGLPPNEAVLVGEVGAGLVLVGIVAFVGWCRWKRTGEPAGLLSEGILVTITPLVFPLTWFLSLITLLLPLTTTVLALRQMPRPARWWFGAVGVSLLPLIAPDVSLSLGEWFLDQHIAGAAWWATLAFAFPTMGVVAFAGTQGYLLWSLCARRVREAAAEQARGMEKSQSKT